MTATIESVRLEVPGFSHDQLRQRGREYATANNVSCNLQIGYGSEKLWKGMFHLVMVGHEVPGGATVIGAGHRMLDSENTWTPLLVKNQYAFEFQGNEVDQLALIASLVGGTALIMPVELEPGTDPFYLWLGFLTVVRDHPKGIVCG